MKKISLTLIILLLSGCIPAELMRQNYITVEKDEFKGETYLCSKLINEPRTTIYYKICRANKMDGSHKDFMYGSVEYASPVPLEYSEAIDINKKKLKIKSDDDRRLGITINQFAIRLPEGYIYKNDNIEIKMYGVSHNAVLKVSTPIIMALREKIKEIETNQSKK